MRLPNLLASRNGRLAAFFLLYITEGIPLGFGATAIATQLRRAGVGPAEIGAFVGSFYLPWAFKWVFGPFVDVFRSQRFGPRRGWILFTQIMLAVTILVLMPVPLPEGLLLFTVILFVHNTFGAIQDVAIDALAVQSLGEDERGLANGLMFAGAAVGSSLGGAGVLYLSTFTGFQASFFFVAGCLLAVTVFVVLPLREKVDAAAARPAGAGWRSVTGEMRQFAVASFRSFLGSRGASSGVFFALLPAGAMSLGLALQTNLSVEVGMRDEEVASLSLWSTVVSGVCMVIGGQLSDRWGRRRTLFVYLAGMSLPVLWLMWQLQQHGYVMPRPPGGPAIPALIGAVWIATMWYAVFQGLMYGTRSAIFMDVTNPAVAATQFTAYMAMMNLAIAIAANWQGLAIEAWGYPVTLLVDAITGLLCLLFLPALKRTDAFSDDRAPARARKTAIVLGAACLLWLPYWQARDLVGKGQPIASTFFTLVFVGAAVFLLAGREVLGAEMRRWRTAALWVAPLLLAMYGRNFLARLEPWPQLRTAAEVLVVLVPLAGAVVLFAVARSDWRAVSESSPAAQPA